MHELQNFPYLHPCWLVDYLFEEIIYHEIRRLIVTYRALKDTVQKQQPFKGMQALIEIIVEGGGGGMIYLRPD